MIPQQGNLHLFVLPLRKNNNQNNRQNSRGDMVFIANKIVLQISFAFLTVTLSHSHFIHVVILE